MLMKQSSWEASKVEPSYQKATPQVHWKPSVCAGEKVPLFHVS